MDIWGLGCILAEMYAGKPIFPGTSSHHQLELILKIMGKPQDGIEIPEDASLAVLSSLNKKFIKKTLKEMIPNLDPVAEDLLQQIFQFNPDNRPSIEKIISHPFFHDCREYLVLKEMPTS